jgi:hypothetical protein
MVNTFLFGCFSHEKISTQGLRHFIIKEEISEKMTESSLETMGKNIRISRSSVFMSF